MTDDADLTGEQAYLDAAYEQLARMRARSEHLLHTMAGTDPDLEWALLRRVRALADTPRALCFGRIDAGNGETWYIGRRHVEDEEADPVVVEWRAPIALPFYRAGRADPMGLTRRRQFVVDGRTLLSIGDDVFAATPRDAAGDGRDLRGRDALLIELERARSGEMIDIVATIQPEQDEVIRSAAPGVLAVQGGPGSGKTAVGLHRAAFLLYGDDAMARANVLVVGPNRTFLRYIAQVLPSLGEHAVVQTTLTDLVPELGGGAVPPEPDAVTERVKGDGRMATVLARALTARRTRSEEDLAVNLGVRRLVVPAAAVEAAVDRVARRSLPWSDGRDVLREQLIGLVAERYEEVAGPPPDGSTLGSQIRRSDGLKDALDRRWPSVAPVTLVADLLAKPAVLAAAAEGLLSGDEQAALRRRRGRAWTASDGPLIDEAKDLIAGQSRTYGHAIVDEAQDLSPMQLRMLARRCPSGSMTLLGDLAQSVGVWARRDWHEVAAWLPTPAGVRVVELRYGYRSPGQVLELAGRLLPEAAPDVTPTLAVRPGRSAPRRVITEAGELLDAVVAETGRLAGEWPTVAVIVPSRLVDEVVAALRAGIDAAVRADPPGRPGGFRGGADAVGEAVADGLGRPVTVVSAEAAKGLEFDAVVVVEPEEIAGERTDRASGLRLLYVALTRPTQHLSMVASAPLPEALAG
ncbi:AAA family ATPase [Acidiferrimicrobium sp. IK]|uniref:HelD family protein n=1 Tax=Acidiferrimicrobium sp. IK TaxID=2871700 RepID=UPI0021CB5A54|nr:ATP-binding domain-containing protein [Acidiferrimicrobium sp. IK]MCU4187326.1 AAA family ATPase [Acidiferrimicrobium sp. IK]